MSAYPWGPVRIIVLLEVCGIVCSAPTAWGVASQGPQCGRALIDRVLCRAFQYRLHEERGRVALFCAATGVASELATPLNLDGSWLLKL